jgi:glycosyltransferase involved in cell wall biosynthesis
MRSPNLHVLHVITGIDRGGAENHLFDLVRHQRACGMAVTVAYLRGNGYWAASLSALGAEVRPLGLRFYGELKPLVRLGWLLRSTEFDLVHAHLPPAELYVRLALLGINRKTVPLLITKHNEERFCDAPGKQVLGRWVARRADRIIAISNAVKRYTCGCGLGLEERKVQTIHYGIDALQFDRSPSAQAASLRLHWGISPDDIAIGFVGRLVPQKDIVTLIRGFALFAATFPRAKLVIVGSGRLEKQLREEATALGILPRVVWAGFCDNITSVMKAFDIFALTSAYEGLGLVLLEAMASGLPVVATRAGAIPEVVADDETGVLVAPGQPKKLAAAFHHLSDSSLRAQFAAAGRARVMREFTLEKMYRETDALYDRCIRRRFIKMEARVACAVSTVN